jgi:hypothetical protein
MNDLLFHAGLKGPLLGPAAGELLSAEGQTTMLAMPVKSNEFRLRCGPKSKPFVELIARA